MIKLTSDGTLATSSLHLISLQYAMSSAYMLRLEFLEMDALLMVSTDGTKSSGLRMDPRGTLDVTIAVSEEIPSRTTLCFLSVR